MREQQGFGPNPDRAEDLAEFVGLLGELRAWAGSPSYRVLARRVGPLMRPPRVVSASTVVDVFKSDRRRLDQDLVVAIVRALGAADEPTIGRWRDACVKAHGLAKSGGPLGVFGQLPADLATFTGRERELARLIDVATRRDDADGANPVVVSAVEGMAGVGKTQLAIHAAHELLRAGRFTDIQLYVNLRGFDLDLRPADPSAVLEAFLRQLGVSPQQIPAARDERAAMYRDRLRDRSALVLLDNAANEDQVRDLIPASPSCLVLITSRRSLAGLDGVTLHPIDTFNDSESLDLLVRIVGRDRVAAEPEAAGRTILFCNRLPLALALAAARLRSRPAWPLAELADRLQAGRLEAIRAGGRALRPVFDLSYRELAEPMQRVFRLLGHHLGPDFTPAMAAALAGISTSQAEDALDTLQDENLIRQSAPGRYELHDLLRLLAVELAHAEPEADPDGPLTRLASWAVATGYAAAVAINSPTLTGIVPDGPGEPPRFASYQDGLNWFDRERQNLTAVQQAAAQAGLHRLVWQVAVVQKHFRLVRHQFDDFLAVQRRAVGAAQAAGDPAAVALTLSVLGMVFITTNRLDEAEDSYLKARQICQDIGDTTGEGGELVNYGAVQSLRGDNELAIDTFTQALDLLQRPDGRRSRSIALSNRGVLHARQGRLAHAVRDTDEALALLRELDDLRQEAMAIGNLAWLHLADRNLDTALGLYLEQHHFGLRLKDTYLQADGLMGAGETHATAGRIDEARHAWRQAARLYEEINHLGAAAARQRLDATHGETEIAWTPTDWADPRHQKEAEEPRLARSENEEEQGGGSTASSQTFCGCSSTGSAEPRPGTPTGQRHPSST